MAKLKPNAFTLVELMVVVGILSLLATIGIVSYSTVTNNARNSKITADFQSIYKNMDQARIFQQKVLGQVTNSFCSDCSGCRTAVDVSTDTTCLNVMTTAYSKITTATLPKDPWNNPYVWDENEAEGGNCNRDLIRSVGPDHKYGTGDDITFSVPFSTNYGC